MQCLEEAEEKSLDKRSPLMFESDEELIGDKENLTVVNKQNHTNDVSSSSSSSSGITMLNECKPLSKEEHLVNRLQTILTGIPPPPAVTVPQYDSDDILKLWKANEHLTIEYKKCMHPGASEQEQAAVEEAATTKWPEVSHCQCMGVCFNKGSLSEELEYLSAKYKERYVGNETSSCVNSLYTKQATLTASAKKRARHRGWCQSPGRRLSHLARRRKAFTSASLQSVAENSSKHPEKKMILIDVRKTRCGKSKGNSCKKKLLGNGDSYKVNSSKRALFQSPDDRSHINVPKRNRQLKCSPKSMRVQQSKRALWPISDSKQVTEGTYVQVNVHKKRERAVCKTSPRKKCNRNLFVNEEVRSCSSFTNTRRKTPRKTCYLERKRTPQRPSGSGLSNSHRQKLLWAISNALREQGIRMNHEMFRPCASVLFKVCQKLWLERRQKITNEGSTSESMLALARQFSSKVVNSVEKDPSNINLAELCTDLIKAAVVEQLVEIEMSYEESASSKVIHAKSIRCDKHNSTTQCQLESEIPDGNISKLKKTESLDYNVAKMQKNRIKNVQDKLCIDDGSKQNFLFIEDEETTFSVLKNDSNTSDYKNGLCDISILKTNSSSAEKKNTIQPSACSSISCDDVSNMNRDFTLNTEAVPSCSSSTGINGLNCLSDKSTFKQAIMCSGIPHTVTDTVCVLKSNDRMNKFSNLIKENAVTVQSVVNNIPVSEMLSWNADPISRLKSNTALDVFVNEDTKVNINVMSHWQNLVTRKEIKQKTDCELPCENYCDPKLDNLCSLESTVDTDCSSSIHSNTVTNYDFSGIIDDSKGWLQSDPIQTYDGIHS